MAQTATLDHAVINVLYQMDEAQALFQGVGFQLTERGYHSMGSINHLMMFGTDYLELIGLPAESDKQLPGRPAIADAALGLNGLVLKTTDADETYAHLQALGMAADPPKSFSRPVDLADGTTDARFRTVSVRAGVFPGGRVYYCEHATPELVWRSQWQSHQNGALSIPEFVVVSADHQSEARNFAQLLNSEVTGDDHLKVALQGGQISVMAPAAYVERYGQLACAVKDRRSIFGAMVIRTDSLDKIRQIVGRMTPPLPMIDETHRVVVRLPAFDSLLEFATARP